MRKVAFKELISRHKYAALFCVIFAALILRTAYFGFEYYPQLDDHIQYYNFARSTDYLQLIKREGLLSSRPLAGLTDIFVWMQLPLYLSAVLINGLYAASAILFLRVFEKHFGTGFFFAIIYALLPLGYEGTYWLSASARVVPGLFFTSLTLCLFDRLCDTKKPIMLLPFLISALLSYGYYEQLLVLSVTLVLMLALLRLTRREPFALFALTIAAPLAGYFVFTNHFASQSSALSARMVTVLPITEDYFETFLPELMGQLTDAFVVGTGAILLRGFVRGLEIIFAERVFGALLISVISVLLFFIVKNGTMAEPSAKPRAGTLSTVIFALLAAIAPTAPFFIIYNPWFSLRNTVASFVGIALFGEALCRRLAEPIKSERIRSNLLAGLAAACVSVFLVVGVSELYDYRATYENDKRVVGAIMRADEEYGLTGNVGIFGLEPAMVDELNFRYHDHIVGVTNSDWALLGALTHYVGKDPGYVPCPLSAEGSFFWVHWNRQTKELSRFDSIFRYDAQSEALVALTLEQHEHEYLVYNPDGSLYARVWDENEPYGYIELFCD